MAPSRRRRERGAAAVEMAIILPLLILLIGGIIDFGRGFMAQVVLTNAASEGTRYAYLQTDFVAAKPQIEARARTTASTAKAVAATNTDPTATFGPCGSSAPNQMSVTVTIPFRYLMLNALPGVSNPQTLSAKSVIGC